MSRKYLHSNNSWRNDRKLQNLLSNGEVSLDELALLFPGIFHINWRLDLSFDYLSSKGCNLIGYSLEQLKRLGSKVLDKHQSAFTREIVHSKVLNELNNITAEKVIIFYQDWKPEGKTPYFFLTATKKWNEDQLISISFFHKDVSYLTPKINRIFSVNQVLSQFYNGYNQLTKREKEILSLLANDKTRQEIASQLYLSQGTVKKHCENIYRKLGTHKRTELEKISKIQVFDRL